MKMLLLFIRKNYRYRKANYFLPFLSFVLSGILLCTSVFYLTLSYDYNMVSRNEYPYDMMMKSSSVRQLRGHSSLILRLFLQMNLPETLTRILHASFLICFC